MIEYVQPVGCLACGEGVLTCPPQKPDGGLIVGRCGFCGESDMVWAGRVMSREDYDRAKAATAIKPDHKPEDCEPCHGSGFIVLKDHDGEGMDDEDNCDCECHPKDAE